MGLKYCIKIGGKEVSSLYNDFIELRMTDDTGLEADNFSLKVYAREREIPNEDSVSIALSDGVGGLQEFGSYKIDEIKYDIPTDTYMISGQNIDLQGSLREKKAHVNKTIKKHESTLGEIIKEIAKKNKLQAEIAPGIAEAVVGTTIQHNESDIHYITRLCKSMFDAVVKIHNGTIYVLRKGDAKSVSGKALPIVVVDRQQIINGDILRKKFDKWGSVKVMWSNVRTHKDVTAVYPENKQPQYTVFQRFRTEKAAMECAKATYRNVNLKHDEMSLQIIGTVELRAERILKIKNGNKKTDGDWLINKAVHTLTKGRYVVEVNCSRYVEE